ncbi:hypothetical protein ABVK25_012410 [Lepraria finkii]|uniref:Tachykinin family protein n=1 Tax=Lepraria finkii TaxID=1340010 RepID=A0ABR4AGG3_9LECA
MNFRFAHYDPPKKKPPKTSTTIPPNASHKPKGKVSHPSSKVAQHKRDRERQRKSAIQTKKRENDERLDEVIDVSSLRLQRTTATNSGDSVPSSVSTELQLATSGSPFPQTQERESRTIVWRYLNQGRIDPFRVYPVDNVPEYVDLILDHAVKQKWANDSPSDETATRRGWMICALENPGTIQNCAAPLVRLSYKTEAVKLINQQLDILKGKPTPDHLLIAILSLGAHGHKPIQNSETKQSAYMDRVRGPKSPLASAQMIDFYGHIDQETAHMSALRTLLAHNKGTSNIELPGLAGALELGDLLHSTITHQKPSLRAKPTVADLPEIAQFLPPEDAETFAPVVTFPLRHASSLPDNTPTTKLLNILTLAETVTAALDYHKHKKNALASSNHKEVSIQSLTLARNYVHHGLLSLAEANSLWGAQFALYNVLRITALIYSDLVLFPLPKETGVRGRYAAMLREVLQGVGSLWRDEAGLLLWACLIGAVAAAEVREFSNVANDSPNAMVDEVVAQEVELVKENGDWVEERTWFVTRVRMCAEMLGVGLGKGVDGWEEVRDKGLHQVPVVEGLPEEEEDEEENKRKRRRLESGGVH